MVPHPQPGEGDPIPPENLTIICHQYSWLPLIGLIPLLVIRILGTRVSVGSNKNDIEWPLVAISVVSYIIWIYAIGDCILGLRFNDSFIIALVVMLWTFLVPYIYRPGNPGG